MAMIRTAMASAVVAGALVLTGCGIAYAAASGAASSGSGTASGSGTTAPSVEPTQLQQDDAQMQTDENALTHDKQQSIHDWFTALKDAHSVQDVRKILPSNSRILQRGDMPTMEYLPNRVNVVMDNGQIMDIWFG